MCDSLKYLEYLVFAISSPRPLTGRARSYRQFMLPYPADRVPRGRPRPASAAQVRLVRGVMLAVILCGLLLVVMALSVFLTQGRQIRVVADVLSERCRPRTDLAYPAGTDSRCDAAVRFTTVTGRVITTTVTDAFPSEFSGSGRSKTIDLRYDSNDPAQPFKQSNYMPASTFISLLASGAVAALLGYWGVARARRLADRLSRRGRMEP
jgi:hypothetical protein